MFNSDTVPCHFLEKWQNIADLLAKIMDIPAALIMKTENECMEVFVASRSEGNPYRCGDKEHWQGLYCETVIKTQDELLVSNALKDKNWDKNPDIKLGMIAYFGIPLNYPNDQPFGTICVLDKKENGFTIENKALLYQFKNVIELDLVLIQSFDWADHSKDMDIVHRLVEQNEEYLAVNEELMQTNTQLFEEKEKFAESEKHFRLLVDNAPDAIFVQVDWKFVYLNRMALELFGAHSSEQLIGCNVLDRFHPDFHQKIKQRVVGLNELQEKQPLSELVVVRFDGSHVPVETSGIPYTYQNSNGALVFARNISERKQAEIELMHRHNLMDYVIRHDPKGIAVFDKELNFVYVSQQFLSDYNLHNFDIIGKNHYEVLPEIPDKWKEAHKRALSGEVITHREDIFIRKNGTVEYVQWECRPWKQNDGSIGGIIVYTELITERKLTENKLKISEDKFRRAFYTIPESVTITRLDTGEYVSLNAGFTQMLGYTEHEAIGKTPVELGVWNSHEERKRFVELIEKNDTVENLEVSFKTKNGNVIDCLVSVSKLSIDDCDCILSITRNITVQKKLENSTRKAYELIKNLAAQVPGVIYQYRLYPDGRSAFPFSSEGMFDIYEVTPEEVKDDASPVFSRIHPDDLGYIVETINESAKNQTVYTSKFRVILPLQGVRWRQCNAQPELLEDGSTLWHGVIMDITEEKIKEDLLNQKNEEINTFFNCALDLLCIGDMQGRFVRMNKEWEHLLGYPLDELKGRKFVDFIHPDDVQPTLLAVNELNRNNEVTNFINRYRCKDGSFRWIEWKSTPVGKRIYGAARDITDKMRITEELVLAKNKAEESSRLKTEFLNNMSHEIRTPMNGIIGFSEMLNNPDISAEKRSYFSKIVRNSSIQLLKIIDDILEISTIETKQMRLYEKSFCLNDLFMELFSAFSKKAKERNISLYLEKGASDMQSCIISDKIKLFRIMSNLLENALKYTNEGFVEFGYRFESEQVLLYVKDTGIGISSQNIEIVFERFSQEEKDLSRSFGGLGLGLSISKENAQILGGDITVESEKGKGSTFFVRIPHKREMDRELDEKCVQIKNEKESCRRITVLIAEDEEINYLYMEALFQHEFSHEYTLIHARNGQEAVEICSQNNAIDIILMDVKMPVMNGHEATRKIKSILSNVPVVAQTAYSTELDREKALAHGCDDFIVKPVSKDRLFEVIALFCGVKISKEDA